MASDRRTDALAQIESDLAAAENARAIIVALLAGIDARLADLRCTAEGLRQYKRLIRASEAAWPPRDWN